MSFTSPRCVPGCTTTTNTWVSPGCSQEVWCHTIGKKNNRKQFYTPTTLNKQTTNQNRFFGWLPLPTTPGNIGLSKLNGRVNQRCRTSTEGAQAGHRAVREHSQQGCQPYGHTVQLVLPVQNMQEYTTDQRVFLQRLS